jgi:hypothetical protein
MTCDNFDTGIEMKKSLSYAPQSPSKLEFGGWTPNSSLACGVQTNLKQTEMLYKKAYGADSDFYLAKFSYAQALSIKSARDIPEPDKLKSKTLLLKRSSNCHERFSHFLFRCG